MKAPTRTRRKNTPTSQLVEEGNLRRRAYDWQGAEESYRRAVTIDPQCSPAWSELGCFLVDGHRFSEAAPCFRRALNLPADEADPDTDPIGALRLLTELTEARPRWAGGQFTLGSAWEHLKDFQKARVHLANALRLSPSRKAPVEALFARMFWMEKKWTEAIQAADQALAVNPNYYLALLIRGRACASLCRMVEADEYVRRALRVRPDKEFHNYLLFEMNYLTSTTPETLYEESCRWNSLYAEPLANEIRPHANSADPDRRLKVGYVSHNLHNHAMMRFFPPVLENHDRSLFEVFVYSVGSLSDEWSEQVRQKAENFCAMEGPGYLPERVRGDGIDILVDLTGQTMGKSMLAFAEKPAPVQVSWLGTLATTGLDTIDYFIGDAHTPCPGTEHLFTEKVCRLPRVHCCYRPYRWDDPVAPAPSIKRGYVTFGCFNNPQKITRDVVRLWSAILHLAPTSRLLLKYGSLETEEIQSPFRAWFAEDGIARERVLFAGFSAPAEYLREYARIDIALDPFPYNGGTTTLDALWMGVPVVTLTGRLAVQTGGLGLLAAAGLSDFAARTPEQYLKAALFLAAIVGKTPDLRSEIRRALQSSPLMNEVGMARAVETAYRDMWHTWCRNRNAC